MDRKEIGTYWPMTSEYVIMYYALIIYALIVAYSSGGYDSYLLSYSCELVAIGRLYRGKDNSKDDSKMIRSNPIFSSRKTSKDTKLISAIKAKIRGQE